MAVSGKSKKELIEEISALRTRLKELEHSKDECKKAQEESKKSKAFLDNVVNSLDDPFFVKDQEHRWLMLNETACELMGRPREELIGKSDYDLFPKAQADVFWERDNLVLETGRTDVNEEQVTWHGKIHTISTKKSLYTDPVTLKKFITGTIRDITELKQSEKTLRESEGKLEAMLGSLAEHMSMMDKDLNIIWANETAKNIFGDDIVGRKCYEAYHQRNKPCEPYPCLTLKAFQDGKVHEHDTQVVDKDGNTRFFHCNANVALRDEQGKPTAVLEISKDVTDQKLAEEALRESESSYRAVVDNSAEGIVVVQDQMLQFVNPALVSMSGYSEKELLTRPFIEFIHPDHREWVMGIHIKRLEGEEVPPFYEFELLDKKGNVKWLENNGILFEWGNRPATLNFLRDITEQKRAKEELKASKEFLENIIDTANALIIVLGSHGNITTFNRFAEELTGYRKDEVLGRNWFDLFIPENEVKTIRRVLEKVLRDRPDVSSYENYIVTKKGPKRLISWNNQSVNDNEGETIAAISIGLDITERKRAEESLKYRVEFEKLITMLSRSFIDPGDIYEKINGVLKAIGEFAKVDRAYVFQLRDDGRTVDNTHEWCAGEIEPQIENLRGITLAEEFPWFWEKMKANETFHVLAAAELPPEAQFEKKYLEMQDIQALVVVPMLSKGILKGFLGFDSIRSRKTWPQDIITLLRISSESISLALDREYAEQRARLLSSTVEQSSEGMAVADLQGILLFLNNAFADMHGYTPEELIGENLSVFHTPEQMPSVEAANRQLKETGNFDGEIWHVRRDGAVFPCLMHNSLLRDEAGKPIGMISTLRDITESKRAEQALKESEIKFRSLTEDSLVGVYLIQDGVFKYVNPKFAETFGYSADELISTKGPDKLVFSEDWPTSTENLRRRIDGEIRSIQYSFRGVTKDKEVIYVETYGSVTQYQGRPAVIGTLMDITDRKKAVNKLLEYQVQLKSLASQLSLIEERERRRLATELHDQIGQSLVMSKMKLDSLRKSRSSGISTKVLDDVSDCLKQVIQDTRTLTFDLSYPILYELGFEVAVAEWLNGQVRDKHGIETEFQDDGQTKPLDDDIRALLFRNVRELLINIVKHANAQKVKVSVSKVDEQICVIVEDDGVGFDVTQVESLVTKKAKFGLFSIRERLEQLAGHLEIKSESGRGSRFKMMAPLKVEKSTEGVEI